MSQDVLKLESTELREDNLYLTCPCFYPVNCKGMAATACAVKLSSLLKRHTKVGMEEAEEWLNMVPFK